MKKYLIIALTAALLLAFFGCGDPPEDSEGAGGGRAAYEFNPDNYTEESLELPAYTDETTGNTGESSSKMYKFTGEDFEKIKDLSKTGVLGITYRSTVNYAVGEIGWIDKTKAGPVIIGNGSDKKQTQYYYIKDLTKVFGTDDSFTIHMFNPSTLVDVTLYTPKDDYDPSQEVNPKATKGAKKIIIPGGHPTNGNGDLAKMDFAMINAASAGEVVFYFDDEVNTTAGVLKFGPKCGDPYKHYGVGKDHNIYDGDDGWRTVDAETKTVRYTVEELQAGVKKAGASFNKFEINQGSQIGGKLLYIELVGDEPVSCTCND